MITVLDAGKISTCAISQQWLAVSLKRKPIAMCSVKKLLQTVILVSIIGLASAPAMALNSSLIILNVDPLAQNRFVGDELGAVDVNTDEIIYGDLGGWLIDLAEVSWLRDLGFQSDEFSLARLSFTGMDLGISELSISDYTLGYAAVDPLCVLATIPGFVQLSPIPVPTAGWLLVSGIVGLVGFHRRNRP